MSKNIRKSGGVFKGLLHSEGGIPFKVPETGQSIEVERDEALIAEEAMQGKTVKKITGTNVEVLDKVNKAAGAKGMSEKAEEVHAGDAIVCRKAMYDKTRRTYIGTDKQIVSAINKGGGCKEIEKGGKAIEPDGSTTQFKKGGDVTDTTARWDKKKKHIEELANNIQGLRWCVTRSLNNPDNEKEYLTALVVATMMKTSERIGNDDSAENDHVGVTGFKKEHVKIDGTTVTFDYTGKSGTEHEKVYTDKLLAKHLKLALKKSNCSYVFCTSDGFRIKSDRVNRFLSDFNISAKDIRGYNANSFIIKKLKNVDIPDTEKDRKKFFNKVVKDVAEKVGHGTATLKTHYMMPELHDNYIFDAEIIDAKEASVFATGGVLADESLEKRVMNRMNEEHKITVKDLTDIIGKEPDYPYEYIGSLKLEKCLHVKFYRLK